MNRQALQRDVQVRLEAIGFETEFRTVAVAVLRHPGRPGLTVRLGVTHVAVELDGQLVDRVPIEEFDARHLPEQPG